MISPNKDEFWFVRLPNATCLSTVKVVDVTQATVRLRTSKFGYEGSRYKIEEVEFVEQTGDWE